jgi:hypothetical protein
MKVDRRCEDWTVEGAVKLRDLCWQYVIRSIGMVTSLTSGGSDHQLKDPLTFSSVVDSRLPGGYVPRLAFSSRPPFSHQQQLAVWLLDSTFNRSCRETRIY